MQVGKMTLNPTIKDPLERLQKITFPTTRPMRYNQNAPTPDPKNLGKSGYGCQCPKCKLPTLFYDSKLDCLKCSHCKACWVRKE